MRDKILFDTNILVYAYDLDEMEKRKVCSKLVEDVFKGNYDGVVTNQILSEFFNAMTRKIENPLSKEEAIQIVKKYIISAKWIKINYNTDTVLKASVSSSYFKTSFWDTLIAETMKENNISRIFTENKKHFSKIPRINVINPISENIKI